MDVLIVEDHELVREGLRMMVVATGLFGSCIECSSLAVALAEAHATGDDLGLVLLDPGLPDAQGLDALVRIHREFPLVPIVVVSGGDDAATINSAFGHGARGYVPKNSSAHALRLAIHSALQGELYVPPHVLPSLYEPQRPSAPLKQTRVGTTTRLTSRQAEVLALLTRGLTNKEIGDLLDMSPSTVRAHVSAILKVLGVENRTQAATSPAAATLLGERERRTR